MPIAADLYYHIHDGEMAAISPLVCLHGAGGTHLHWPPEVRRLPGRRVYAPDLPGHGKSTGHGEQSIAAYAQRLLDWTQAVDIRRAVIAGHSMGAAIALHLALAHSSLVRALILVGAGVRMRVHPDLLENAASRTTLPIAIKTLVDWSYSPQADPRLVELALQRMGDTRLSVLHGDFLACDGFDVMGQIGAVSCPTLVICGQDDRMTPPRYAQYLAGHIPGAELKIIPGAGHMVMLEQPKAVSDAMATFLERLS